MVANVREGNIVVDFDGAFVVAEEIENIGRGGRHPATSLIVKFVESFRAVSEGIAGCAVLDAVAALE